MSEVTLFGEMTNERSDAFWRSDLRRQKSNHLVAVTELIFTTRPPLPFSIMSLIASCKTNQPPSRFIAIICLYESLGNNLLKNTDLSFFEHFGSEPFKPKAFLY